MSTPLVTEPLEAATYKDYKRFIALARFSYQHRHKVRLEIIQDAMTVLLERILLKNIARIEDTLERLDEFLSKAFDEPVPPEVFLIMAYQKVSSMLESPSTVVEKSYQNFMLTLGHVCAVSYNKDAADVLNDLVAEFENIDEAFEIWSLRLRQSPSQGVH